MNNIELVRAVEKRVHVCKTCHQAPTVRIRKQYLGGPKLGGAFETRFAVYCTGTKSDCSLAFVAYYKADEAIQLWNEKHGQH
jgi:hypothetical protein